MTITYICEAIERHSKLPLGDMFTVAIDNAYQNEYNAKHIAVKQFEEKYPEYKKLGFYIEAYPIEE